MAYSFSTLVLKVFYKEGREEKEEKDKKIINLKMWYTFLSGISIIDCKGLVSALSTGCVA